MKLYTVKLNGIKFDAYYSIDITVDPYATGDRNYRHYDVTIEELSLTNDTQDLSSVINDTWISDAIEQIVKAESLGEV